MASAATGTSIETERKATTETAMHRYLARSERRLPAISVRGIVRQVVVLVGTWLVVAGLVVGVCWMAWSFAAGAPEPPVATPPRPSPPAPMPQAPRIRTAEAEVVHTDVFFGVKQTRLSADAVAVLQDTAAYIREEGGTWRLLVQGHADGQGAASYNLALAERRADAVRQFLVELGLRGDDIRVVTIGQAGALCDDATPTCQQLNRRVHLEARRMPQAVTPPAAESVPPARLFGEEGR